MVNDKKTSYNSKELLELNLEFSHDEIIQNLNCSCCDDFVKIFSIVNLDKLYSLDETVSLFNNLTNHPTPVREVVAFKLEEIYDDKFFNSEIKEQFLRSIIDINPNVCRAICNLISKSEFLQNELSDEIIKRINELLNEIKQNDKELGGFFDDALKIRKNHAKNKKLFSLYWYLEALSICIGRKTNSLVLEIVKQTIKFNDYTIREKSAKILAKLDNPPIELLNFAKLDQNFYVKNQVYDKISMK